MAAARAYLDYNASAPLLPAARDGDACRARRRRQSVLGACAKGAPARRLIETARRDVAALVNAKPEHVVFTSGATEAASTLLTPDWQMGRGAVRMAGSMSRAADHPCLLNGGRFPSDAGRRASASTRDGIADLAASGGGAGRS